MTIEVPTGIALKAELKRAKLPDRRLTKRLGLLVESIADAPASSLPRLCPTDGELEGAYRFLNNPRVDWQVVLEPHLKATAKRAKTQAVVIVAHDSSSFHFAGERDGLGKVDGGEGFLGHFSLAIGENRRCLGMLSAEVILRGTDDAPRGKESKRWWRNVSASEQRLRLTGQRAIHVADREAGFYGLMSKMKDKNYRFIFRSVGKKTLEFKDSHPQLSEHLKKASGVFLGEVPLSKRKPKALLNDLIHPPRAERQASLHVRAEEITLIRPPGNEKCPEKLTINVVDVFEPNPPPGEAAVRWLLLTTEPVDTLEQLKAIVDAYRSRWVIEEYFKALKSGCAYQERQLESAHALLNALALFIPIAWRLLLLRDATRQTPERPARDFFSEEDLSLLAVLSRRVKLPREPTVEQVFLAIAGIGGHLKRNGPPGWITVSRGYSTFMTAQWGWIAARETM